MPRAFLTDRERAAEKVVDLAKALLLADNHFLSAAIGRMRVRPALIGRSFATDGTELAVDAQVVCEKFRRDQVAPKHDLLHTVLHCVFMHPFVGAEVDSRLWDLACDIAVERNVRLLCGPREGGRGDAIAYALGLIEGMLGPNLTAERIYRALRTGSLGTTYGCELVSWEILFACDDHAPWHAQAQAAAKGGDQDDGQDDNLDDLDDLDDLDNPDDLNDGPDNGQDSNQDASQNSENADGDSLEPNDDSADVEIGEASRSGSADGGAENAFSSESDELDDLDESELRLPNRLSEADQEAWRRVAKALSVNLQTYSRDRGKNLGDLVSELEETVHERVDYGDFLRQFSTPGEVLKLSEDEFDYVFYTYGLSLYGNLPLVEPLEFREEKRVREFVIVIDTSGSVYGEIVQRFIDETFDILKSTEAFFEKVHVRIIQCDMTVRSDDVITSLDELKSWGRKVTVRGNGGTDFRPAFRYVDGLVEDGAFENLGGLIYFTDGWGIYPEWMPDYQVAFVFYDEGYRPEEVPTWAAQIVLGDQQFSGGNNQEKGDQHKLFEFVG